MKSEPDNHPGNDLCENLEFAPKSFLVLFKNLDIIINKSDGTQPYGYEDHQKHINILQISKKDYRNDDGSMNDQSAHRRCSFFLHLSLQSQVTDRFPDLRLLQFTDDHFSIQH